MDVREHHGGLDADGHIEREGSLARVPRAFGPVVAAARERLLDTFGTRLDGAYLYGSIPRGTARVGRSDLDLLLSLRTDPTERDRADARALEAALDGEFTEIDGVGTLLFSRERLLSDLERHDLALLLPGWRERIAAAGDTDEARRPLVRSMSRHLVRTGFTLVMPRWNGWTSDLGEMAGAFGTYYPERAADLRNAAVRGHEPTGDPAVLRSYVDDLGPWLAGEYARVHGIKAPRP
ncbi:nucleotidyltransferase [Streptomyces sp. NPDC002516]